jgi:hypothetical protein
MRNQTMYVPGTSGFAIPSDAQPVGVAGETAWLLLEGDKCRLWVKLGAAAGTVSASSKLRHGTGCVAKVLRNRRNTAAGAELILAKGQWFEAKGYARISEWKRYIFDGQTIVAG